MQVCHVGHDFFEPDRSPCSFYCDCGHGRFSQKCKCLPDTAPDIAANANGEETMTPFSEQLYVVDERRVSSRGF